jgi:hypothetical protein
MVVETKSPGDGRWLSPQHSQKALEKAEKRKDWEKEYPFVLPAAKERLPA